MKFDNVDYRERDSEGRPISETVTDRNRAARDPQKFAATLFQVIFCGIGTLFAVIGIVLLIAGGGYSPMPGMMFFPMGIFFAILGATIGRAIRGGQMRVQTHSYSRSTSQQEPYSYSSNPAYGASEHDELRARVSAQERRIAELERKIEDLSRLVRSMH